MLKKPERLLTFLQSKIAGFQNSVSISFVDISKHCVCLYLQKRLRQNFALKSKLGLDLEMCWKNAY